MKFCANCNNILYVNTVNNNLTYTCKVCLNSIPADNEDTLLLDVRLNNEEDLLIKYESLINLSIKDNTLPLIHMKCKNSKCDETILKYIILGDSMQYIYICTKCNYRFFE